MSEGFNELRLSFHFGVFVGCVIGAIVGILVWIFAGTFLLAPAQLTIQSENETMHATYSTKLVTPAFTEYDINSRGQRFNLKIIKENTK